MGERRSQQSTQGLTGHCKDMGFTETESHSEVLGKAWHDLLCSNRISA